MSIKKRGTITASQKGIKDEYKMDLLYSGEDTFIAAHSLGSLPEKKRRKT